MDNTDLRHHCYAMGYSDGEVGAFYDGYEQGRADCLREAHRFADQESYKEGYKRGLEQGRADGVREFAEWLSNTEYVTSQGHFILPLRGFFTVDDVVSEWEKEQK